MEDIDVIDDNNGTEGDVQKLFNKIRKESMSKSPLKRTINLHVSLKMRDDQG